MVTAKREIKTEEERYGGYAPRQVRTIAHPAPQASYFREYSSHDECVDERYEEKGDSVIMRRREEMPVKIRVTEAEPVTITPPTMPKRKVFEPQEDESADLYPTSATMRSLSTDADTMREERTSVSPRRRIKLNARGKAIVAGYVVVIVALLVVVILNAVAIGGVSASVSALEGAVASATEEVNGKNVELNNVTRPSAPSDMVEPSGSVKLELPVSTKQPQTIVKANWFERFCAFLSGIFGG